MIDTIKVHPWKSIAIDDPKHALSNVMPAWTCRNETMALSHEARTRDTLSIAHRENGLRVSFRDRKLAYAEASLPRLLHGSNGLQLRTPIGLENSLIQFLHHLKVFAPQARRSDMIVDRIDLALNLYMDPRQVLAIHRNARHPRIRRETQSFFNQNPTPKNRRSPHIMSDLNTITLNGVNTRISFYDKQREIATKTGTDWPDSSCSTRVEIQLRGKQHIAKLFGFDHIGHLRLDLLTIGRSYQVFRNIMLQFDHLGRLPDFKPTLTSCIAILEACPETHRHLGGMTPLDWCRTTKATTDKHFLEFRNQVRRQQLALSGFRWSDHLPADRLPDLVDIPENGNAVLIPSSVRPS